ncbi:pyridoxal phosphate-dependent transferase [Aspergillus karnatakaensis]|uniref:pyridoxal phosphate-dependent transferase n=1 Tax=Aspergillus karnatakaensis TaxID=1810916 RepID=UPI003CCCBD6B
MIAKLDDPYSFLDDYSEGAHPRLLEALLRTNSTQQTGYGTDQYTQEARQLLFSQLQATEEDVSIHFVPTGTAANLISIASCLRPYEAVLAVQTGHIIDKEAGAIEATGHKIIQVPGERGKMTPENLEIVLDQNTFFPHMAKPRLVYISNATEIGTIYSRQELQALSQTCRRRDLLLLVDGARLGVALTAEGNDVTLRDMVDYTDIFWIGGTKMGALLGEAIVVRKALSEGFEFHMKQRGALLGKSRVMGVQFTELFQDGLFFELARHANAMARMIATQFLREGWELAAETETNQVFVVVPDEMLPLLEERIRFYAWQRRIKDKTTVIRIVTSWATEEGQPVALIIIIIMRLSISCDHCRQSKVKCIHDGQSPCRRCLRLNRSPCLLTDPRSPSSRTPSAKPPRRQPARPRLTTQTPTPAPPPPSTPSSPISALSSSTLIAACDLYRKKFPVVNFLHYPSLITDLSRNATTVEPVFLGALLSLCARFLPDAGLSSSETYAEYARTQLAHRAFESPSLPLAQSLVMISLYEWGSGRPYRAWMYSGMATYMIQSLLKSADDHMEHAPEEFQTHAQIAYEQLVRTYWCCFAQDCELSSGARQHFALSFHQISVPLPISDSDFNFGRSTRRLTPADIQRAVPRGVRLGIEHGLTLVTRGFDIFVRILRFANESRRDRARGPSLSSIPIWRDLKQELDEWRTLQDITVHYPDTSAPAHVALGYGELFCYINLVYFMSILFLYRDRFLAGPKVHDTPEQLEEDTEITLERLFSTAQHIGAILSSLESCATPVITPYAGFSVFVAAHINMYGTVCPVRYPGGIERAEQEKKSNFSYLERLCRFWDVGNSWWQTLQEANRFYESARSTQQGLESDRDHLTLAGTFDEYGDIRISRPDSSITRPATPTNQHVAAIRRSSVFIDAENGMPYDLEAEMMQWPFLDETWSVGFATGYENTWPGLG